MRKHLRFLGLDEKTSDIYTAGIDTGPCTAAKLAEITEIKRPSIYPLLERLLAMRLATKATMNGTTLFTMANPSVIKRLLKAKEAYARNLHNTLPRKVERLTLTNRERTAPRIRTTRGKKELLSIIETIRKTKGEICWIGNLEKLLGQIPEPELFKLFSAKRMRRKVTTRAITDRSIERVKLFREKLGDYRQFRFTDRFDSSVIVALWENKIGILDPDNNCAYIEIQDDAIASYFQHIFNMLWNALK